MIISENCVKITKETDRNIFEWYEGMIFMTAFIMRLVNYLVAFVSAILLMFNISPVREGGDKIDLDNYELTFSDDFNGTELDSSLWRAHNGEGVRRGGYWSLDCVSVYDGNLHIATRYEADGKFGAGWYTAGISTQDKFMQTYGYYECRCILPKGTGMWAAFWLTNPNVSKYETGNATQGAEIDVFESPYYYRTINNNLVSSNIHYNGYGIQTKYSNVGIWQLDNNPYENYNTYGVEWTQNGYTFFINGNKVGSSSFGGVSTQDEYMILSCETDGDSASPIRGWSGLITDNEQPFTADFIVDYVKAYSRVNG